MVIRVSPDMAKARSLRLMALDRKRLIGKLKSIRYPIIVAENYYEIIKELIMALLLVEGRKAVGENAHRDAVIEISKWEILNQTQISLVDDLRIKGNNSYYAGKQIDEVFVENNSRYLDEVIEKLDLSLSKRLS